MNTKRRINRDPHNPPNFQEWRSVTGGDYQQYLKEVKPLQMAAGNVARGAVTCGLLPPASDSPCVDCGKPATVYDHRDYRKPLDVEPVCHGCNRKRGPALPYRLEQ